MEVAPPDDTNTNATTEGGSITQSAEDVKKHLMEAEKLNLAYHAKVTQEERLMAKNTKHFWYGIFFRILILIAGAILYVFLQLQFMKHRMRSYFTWYDTISEGKSSCGSPGKWIDLTTIGVCAYDPSLASLLNTFMLTVSLSQTSSLFAIDVIDMCNKNPSLLTNECWGGIVALKDDETIADKWLPYGIENANEDAYNTWRSSSSQNPWVNVYGDIGYERFFKIGGINKFVSEGTSQRYTDTYFGVMLISGISGMIRESSTTDRTSSDLYSYMFSLPKNKSDSCSPSNAHTALSAVSVGVTLSFSVPYAGPFIGIGTAGAMYYFGEKSNDDMQAKCEKESKDVEEV